LVRRQWWAEQRRPRDEESLQHCTGRPLISDFAHSLRRSRDDLLAWYVLPFTAFALHCICSSLPLPFPALALAFNGFAFCCLRPSPCSAFALHCLCPSVPLPFTPFALDYLCPSMLLPVTAFALPCCSCHTGDAEV